MLTSLGVFWIHFVINNVESSKKPQNELEPAILLKCPTIHGRDPVICSVWQEVLMLKMLKILACFPKCWKLWGW